MSDRWYACIQIGGCLPREHVSRLCALMGADGDDDEVLRQRLEGGRLSHEDSQAAGGAFEELEEACRELGLAYIRRSDGYWEVLPQVEFWQPGMAEPVGITTDSDGRPLAPMATLIETRDLLRAGRSAAALALLEDAAVEVPELPLFCVLCS